MSISGCVDIAPPVSAGAPVLLPVSILALQTDLQHELLARGPGYLGDCDQLGHVRQQDGGEDADQQRGESDHHDGEVGLPGKIRGRTNCGQARRRESWSRSITYGARLISRVTVILNPLASGCNGRKYYEKYCAPLLNLADMKVCYV